jgi:hypothetical protein
MKLLKEGRGKQGNIVMHTYLLSALYVRTCASSRPRARHNVESALSLALLTTASSRGRGKARSTACAFSRLFFFFPGVSVYQTGAVYFPRLKPLSASEKVTPSVEVLESGGLR